MGHSLAGAAMLGVYDGDTLLDLGFACSTGSNGDPVDLVAAHKWFNLAALAGSPEAQHCRTDIAGQMSAREVAEAQRGARAWLADHAFH